MSRWLYQKLRALSLSGCLVVFLACSGRILWLLGSYPSGFTNDEWAGQLLAAGIFWSLAMISLGMTTVELED